MSTDTANKRSSQKFQQILEEFGLGSVAADLASLARPSISVRRTPLATAHWPKLFQDISRQIRAHHEKQGHGGHVVKPRPILERKKIEVPAGPLSLEDGQYYDEIAEYLCREALQGSILPLGTSRLGGQPDLPVTLDWPTWNVPAMHGHRGDLVREEAPDAKLTFLAQINLAELQQQVKTPGFPDDGMLLFFYDAAAEPWGFDPADLAGHRVIYTPPNRELTRRICPDVEHCLAPAPARFEQIETLPKFAEETLDWLRLGIDAEGIDWYGLDDALGILRPARPQHHLFGNAYQVQPGSMQAQCQLVRNGFNVGYEAGWEAGMSTAGIADGIQNWELLLQFDSEDTDDGLGGMWGDCGLLYFWIEKQRLAEKDFSNTCVILQGS